MQLNYNGMPAWGILVSTVKLAPVLLIQKGVSTGNNFRYSEYF
jgi:hypothetical protein